MDTYTYRQIGDWLRNIAQIPPHLKGYRMLQRLIMDILLDPDIIFLRRLDAHCRQLDTALGYRRGGVHAICQRAIYHGGARYNDMGLSRFLALAAEDLAAATIPSK